MDSMLIPVDCPLHFVRGAIEIRLLARQLYNHLQSHDPSATYASSQLTSSTAVHFQKRLYRSNVSAHLLAPFIIGPPPSLSILKVVLSHTHSPASDSPATPRDLDTSLSIHEVPDAWSSDPPNPSARPCQTAN